MRIGMMMSASVCLCILSACSFDLVSVGEGEDGKLDAISITPKSATIDAIGFARPLSASARDANGGAIGGVAFAWSSSNPNVATVATDGRVTGIGTGTARIVAAASGRADTADISVRQIPASLELSSAVLALALGTSARLHAAVKDAGGTVIPGSTITWASSSPSIASVSSSGLVTAVSAGDAVISASGGQAPNSVTSTASVSVTTVPVATVVVSPASSTLSVGGAIQLSASTKDAEGNELSARAVTWSSSSPGVAAVSGSGRVTGLAAGSATITATSEEKSGTATVSVTVPPVATVTVSPASSSILVGATVQLSTVTTDASGNVLTGRTLTWTSSNTAVSTVNGTGVVTGVAAGSATITATSEGKSGTASVAVTVQPVATVTVTPSSASILVGATTQLSAVTKDANGNVLTGRTVSWSSSTAGVATVSGSGLVTGVAAGSATITATSEGKSGTASVVVSAPVPPPAGQFVSYPNAQIAFIAGPQVVAGTSPWSFFDANASTTGRRHGSAFVWTIESTNYYDQGLVQYINYYRTGDATFRTYARNIADTWYAGEYIREGTAPTDERGFSPRRVSLGGLMLRALDGRPEMWDWMYRYVNYMYWLWVERFNGNTHEIINSYREPGYITLYAAQLAKVLPDSYPRVGGGMVTDGAAKRADLLQRLERDAVGYFTVTQRAEGSWRWTSSEENVYETMPMVFMGVWLEGLVAIDQVSSNAAVHTALRSAIVRYATHLGTSGVYRLSDGVIGTDGKPMGVNFRSSWYFYHGGTTSNRTAYATGGGAHPTNQPIPYLDMIREQRQLNPTHLHVFGYAYRLTGDPKFLAWGDEWFASTFGKGQGPLADAWYALCDWNEKSYNQCYRSSGRYLAWRAGHP